MKTVTYLAALTAIAVGACAHADEAIMVSIRTWR